MANDTLLTGLDEDQYAKFRAMMAEAEGIRPKVYRDSRGVLTVGIGHKVLPGDGLRLGDTIGPDRIETLFRQDATSALSAARTQAGDVGITDREFIPHLASVNFQLGPEWNRKFRKTWGAMAAGDYGTAAIGGREIEMDAANAEAGSRLPRRTLGPASLARGNGRGLGRPTQMKGAAGLALGLTVLFSTAAQAASSGSVYCTKAVQFAARIEPDGALSFGVSTWNEHGDNSFVFGVAEKRGGHWEYAKDLASPDERARCRLSIDFSLRKGVSLAADPAAICADSGGFGRLRLSAKTYQGPLTTELDDPAGFFESPRGLLSKGVCFGQKPG